MCSQDQVVSDSQLVTLLCLEHLGQLRMAAVVIIRASWVLRAGYRAKPKVPVLDLLPPVWWVSLSAPLYGQRGSEEGQTCSPVGDKSGQADVV